MNLCKTPVIVISEFYMLICHDGYAFGKGLSISISSNPHVIGRIRIPSSSKLLLLIFLCHPTTIVWDRMSSLREEHVVHKDAA